MLDLLHCVRRMRCLRPPQSSPLPPGKYQVFWRVEGFDFELQEVTLKKLAIAFGGDPACTDCNRVLRIPGFLNRKYSPPYTVAVEYPSDAVAQPSGFRLPDDMEVTAPLSRGYARPSGSRKDSHSEADWAWACHEIAQGRDAGKLTHELASRPANKPNPLYYAQRTVDMASARQWFLEGAPIDDVIRMLLDRRRLELSPAVCSAREREISSTAQRIVNRKNIA